jgi:ribose transport system substrate-binding protein
MRRGKLIGLVAVLALVVAPSGGARAEGTTTTAPPAPTTTAAPATTTTSGDTTDTTAGTGEDPLAAYGESRNADPALIEKAMGPIAPPEGDPAWDIILAAIARADQDPDQATIDKAIECWSNPECDTGTGGELTMGFADGGGHLNVWRGVTHMEAILQALTYPEIGRIISTEALWNPDPAVAANDIRFLIQQGVDFITGYPDAGVAIGDAIKEATAAGIPYIPWSAGWVGLPGQDGALVPGQDYLTVVGENLCALGESMAAILNENVGEGKIGVLGGTPGNALSLGWQQCLVPALNSGIEVVGPADTFWVNDIALQVVLGWLSTDPDIKGYAYEYSDGMNTALQAYDQLGIPVENLTLAMRTDEMTLFCDWVARGEPASYNIFYTAGGNFQSRVAVTAAMMYLKGAEIPSQIDVPHVERKASASDCDPNAPTPTVSGTSLVPGSVLQLMFGS